MKLREELSSPFAILSMDVYLNLSMFLVFMLVMVIPFINDPGQENDYVIDLPGQLMVELSWEDTNNADIDLWAMGPDEVAVGFRNPTSRFFNLLRDDRGRVDDNSDRNYEVLFSRGLPNGEYVFNAHLFSLNEGRLPIELEYTVGLQLEPDTPMEIIDTGTFSISQIREEITFVSFTIIDHGVLSHTIDNETQFEIVPPIVFNFEQ